MNIELCSQAWHDTAAAFVESRYEVAFEKVKHEVTSMFSDGYMTKGGRWDFDGFRMRLAAISAVRSVTAGAAMQG